MTPSTIFPDKHSSEKRAPEPPVRAVRVLRIFLPLLFWLGVWQLAAWQVDKELFLPAPTAVLAALGRLLGQPLFWRSALATLSRVFAGWLAGAVLGTSLAVLTSASGWARLLLAPVIRVIRATPVASFILLVLVWVQTGRVPGVIAGLMVLPVVWGNVDQGIGQTDPLLLELARAYRFGPWKTLRLVYLPSVLPYFASGCSTALGLAWKSGVAAEVICQPKLAIGTQVQYAKFALNMPALFAWTLAVIALSLLLEWLLGRLFRRLRGGGAPCSR